MIEDEIISIEKIENDLTIDIEVSGNHLFYANDILTHNSNSDVGLEDTSESFGLPATADFMFALISTEELAEANQMMIKQLKNRYNDTAANRKFIVGVNRAKMKVYDIKKEEASIIPASNKKQLEQKTFGKEQQKKSVDDWNF